jgi:hypothetical protein
MVNLYMHILPQNAYELKTKKDKNQTNRGEYNYVWDFKKIG